MKHPGIFLSWCSIDAARFAVEHWHYSKQLPAARQLRIGVWEDDVFIGVILIGDSISPQLGKSVGVGRFEVAELTRIALQEHDAPVTKMVAIAIRMTKKQCPKLRVLVSFADSAQGHHGGIYAGGNWIYLGVSHVTQYYVRQKWRNDTATMRLVGKLKHKPESRRSLPKHKYVFPLDTGIRKALRKQAKPYPKRHAAEA